MMKTEALTAKPITQYSDYREYLRNVLEEKQQKNSRYSLRSFAKTIGVAPSSLSSALSGTRGLSTQHALIVGKKLGLGILERKYLKLLVELSDAKDESQKEKISEDLEEIQWLIEAAERVSSTKIEINPEWFHFALIAWISKSTEWSLHELPELAQDLDIEQEVLQKALSDLILKGVLALKQDDANQVLRSTQPVSLFSDAPNEVFKKIHTKITEKAMTALRDQGPEKRYSASEFYSFSKEGFERLKVVSNQYLDQVQYIAKKDKNANRLFSISLHAFEMIPEKKK